MKFDALDVCLQNAVIVDGLEDAELTALLDRPVVHDSQILEGLDVPILKRLDVTAHDCHVLLHALGILAVELPIDEEELASRSVYHRELS